MHWIRVCLMSSLLLIFYQTSAQDEFSPARWYHNFFTEKSARPLDHEMERLDARWLEAVEMQDDSARAFLKLEMGLVYLAQTANYDSAMDCFIEALTISDSLNSLTPKILTATAIARVFEDVGNYEKSLKFLEDAFALSVRTNDPSLNALVLNSLGKVNARIGATEDAATNFEQALKQKNIIENSVEAEILVNLANLYVEKGDYSTAITHQKKALSIWRSLGNRMQEAFLLNEIGKVYHLMKNDERALANFVAAVEVYRITDYKRGIAEAYNNIGELLYSQRKFQPAIDTLQKALSIGASQVKHVAATSYEYLGLCYEALGNYQKALEFNTQFMAMNEFIQKEASDQKLLEAQNRYVLGQKETQIEHLELVRKQRELELAEQRRIQNLLFVIILASAVVAVLIFYLYLVKRRTNRQLQASHAKIEAQNIELQNLNATKDKFFSIIGHDLKGPLNSLSSFSNLLINYFESLSKEEIQTLAKDLDKSVKNLYSLLDNLLEWARSQTGKIEFTPARFDVTAVLEQNKELLLPQAANKSITIVHESQGALWAWAHQPSVTTVIRNLVANAIKFTPRSGSVKMKAIQSNGSLEVIVSDTGVGMSTEVMNKLFRLDAKHSTLGTDKEKGTGLGLILCKDLVEKNGGRLWIESEEGKGSTFYFTLPLAKEGQ